MSEFVVLVDGNDRQIGTEEKVRCHLPDGKLHRAFTALLFDDSGRLALARRAEGKMLWPGFWDGTFASHPRENESYVDSGARRMPDELSGAAAELDYLNRFEYHVPYKDVGSENEICATLVGTVAEPSALKGTEGEIDEIRWVSAGDLLSETKSDPGIFCPWMLIALKLLDGSDMRALEKHPRLLESWGGAEMSGELSAAIRAHLPDDQWGPVG